MRADQNADNTLKNVPLYGIPASLAFGYVLLDSLVERQLTDFTQLRRCLHDLRSRRLRMNTRRRIQPAPVHFAPGGYDDKHLRRFKKSTVRKEGYRKFHPVTSTLVILGCGIAGFFIVYNLAVQFCVYFGLL